MSNQHAQIQTAETLITTAETIIATIGPFSVNQGVSAGGTGDLRLLQPATPPGAEGVLLTAGLNITIGTAGTIVNLRVRPNLIGNTAIGLTKQYGVSAGTTWQLSGSWMDTVLSYPTGILYLLTAQITAATGNSTVNEVIFSSEDCNSFE